MTSAADCNRRVAFTKRLRLSAQGLLPDLGRSPPWISRLTFAAQVLDLPNRLNENGFVMVWLRGPTRRAGPAFYQVSVRNLAALTNIAAGCDTDRAFRGCFPTIGRSHAVALV